MCETFPPNKREVCLVARTSIKVGSENRLRFKGVIAQFFYWATTALD
jgi:hypothetical protein